MAPRRTFNELSTAATCASVGVMYKASRPFLVVSNKSSRDGMSPTSHIAYRLEPGLAATTMAHPARRSSANRGMCQSYNRVLNWQGKWIILR